jgi:peptidoglycan/LPS O-acetylase OafA/YrhL
VLRFLALDPYGPLFAGGCFFYLVLDKGWNGSRALGLIVAAVSSAALSLRQRADFITPDSISMIVVPLAVIAFYAAFAMLALRPHLKIDAALAYRLGALTYPLYLIHGTIGHLLFEALAPTLGVWARIGIITALALLLAYTMSITAETHGRKLFERTLRRVLNVLPFVARRSET